jgi:unsaturated rhamnogalacturonyl hydrolase
VFLQGNLLGTEGAFVSNGLHLRLPPAPRILIAKSLVLALWIVLPLAQAQGASAISHVQQGSNSDISGKSYTSYSATFSSATTGGNAVILGITYGNANPTITASDSQGNAYTQAIKTYDSGHRQGCAIFYAMSIKGGSADSVTVNFSSAVAYLAMGVHEYSGVATSAALDGTAGNMGSGSSLSSGAATTTAIGDLIFGCGVEDSTGQGDTFTAGSGFTKRVDLGKAAAYADEDQVQNAMGSIAVSWTLAPAGSWISDLAAFKAVGGGGGGTAPSIGSLSATTGPVGTPVTITGTNFGTTQGSSTVSFAGTAATATSWNASSIAVTVPVGAMTGSVVVTVGGVASNGVTFTVTVLAPNITGLSPTSGPVGAAVTIMGTNFGTTQGSSMVSFAGTAATATSWNASSITVTVPAGAMTGNVVVTVAGQASNSVNFTVLPQSVPPLPSRAQVLSTMETANNYWTSANPTPGNSDWAEATYFTGDLAAYDATGQANYLSFAQSWASENEYSLYTGNTTTDADSQAAGQAYIRLYQLSQNSSDLLGITDSISGMVQSTEVDEWTWIDAINMSMPDFAELGLINNDTSYYTKMYALYSYTKYSLSLYNPANNLWWRDSSYAGTSTYWSRGNGWVFAAHAKVLSVLPTSDPHYAEYLSTFVSMAQALAARQQPGGYWNSDLGGTDYAGPESSGTSLFLYGFAWGVNAGILDQSAYLPVIENAWNFLANTAIQTQPSGLLGYVQPSGSAPGPTTATTTEDFGVGAFLLAGGQVALLAH